jgi:hypothetical protein
MSGTDSGFRKRMRSIKTRQSRLLDAGSHRQNNVAGIFYQYFRFQVVRGLRESAICRRRGRIVVPTDYEYIRDADMAARDTQTATPI